MLRKVVTTLAVAAAVCGPVPGVSAAGGTTLPSAEVRQWIAALRAQKTDDGSTVAEVLAYAQRMRQAAE